MDELPEFLLHKIMLFLPFREAVRTTILSSKFHSAWRSIPILKFDSGDSYHRNRHQPILQFAFKSLQNHSTNLEKLSIRADFRYTYDTLVIDTILLAASCNVRELELINCDEKVRDLEDCRYFSVVLRESVFFLKSLNVLKLEGFRFETRHVVLGHTSSLKKLRVSRSLGLHNLTMNKATNLESLEIEDCEELKLVEIDAPNLKRFRFFGHSSMDKSEFMLSPDSKSLKTLSLSHVSFTNLFWQNISPIQSIEYLFLEMEVKWIYIDLINLEKFDLTSTPGLVSIEILSKNIKSCVFDLGPSPACEIKFNGVGTFLKALNLSGSETITGSWILQNLSQFLVLESLILEACNKLEWITFGHERLKKLRLISCTALMKVDIYAPMLAYVVLCLRGKIPSYVLIRSPTLRVELSLQLSSTEDVPYDDLRNFLASFNNCKKLTLDLTSNFDLLIPSNAREKRIPLLYNLEHLKVELGSFEYKFSELLSCLLWIAPFPNCITFILPNGRGDQSIQFEYADFEAEEEDRKSCCNHYYPIKCWIHRLKILGLSNFKAEDRSEHTKKMDIMNFFLEKAYRIDALNDDS